MVSGNGAPPPFSPTREQAKIIDFRGGHLQVVACAGSGKTETMARRIAELISEGAEPRGIVAFTFTERAAASLKSRIIKRVAGKMGDAFLGRLAPMFVGTIHAYCLQLLQNHSPQYENYDILDEHQQAALLSREYYRLNLNELGDRYWRPIFDFKRNADAVENELIEPSKLGNTAFGDCYQRYCATLKNYRLLTYGQLITSAVIALKDPVTFERVHGPLRHVIVDEYQDINPAQERLIASLSRHPVRLCVVGDDDQSIYQWRGSDVLNIQNFRKKYRAKAFSLSTNRRSRPAIISAAAAFAKSIQPRLLKKMKSTRPAAGPEVCTWSEKNEESEAALIASTIDSLRERGYRYRDIAILLRSVRTSARPLIAALRKRGIPLRCAGRTGLFFHPEAQLLSKTYAWLADNSWRSESFEEQAVDLKALIHEYRELFHVDASGAGKLRAHLQRWNDQAHKDDEHANLIREYYALLRLLNVHEWDLSDPAAVARLGCLAKFSQLLRDFEHVTRRGRWVEERGGPVYRGGQNRGPWYYRRLFNYIRYYAFDAYEDFQGEEDFESDAVDILTVHQAKGLEWPVVFMPCLVRGRFPSKFAGTPQSWLVPKRVFSAETRGRYEGGEVDERRLFYVGITRGRDVVYLSWFQKRKKRFTPSAFFVEVARKTLNSPKQLPLPPAFTPSDDDEGEKPTFGFSELSDYERCGLAYRLENLIGFQPQIAQELGYGKAIHHVLRRIGDYVNEKRRLPSQAEVENLFSAEFYVPFATRIGFDELRKAARRVVHRYLDEYSDDLFRIWETERQFELQLENATVSGRADVILDREGGAASAMALVDYKTAVNSAADDLYGFQLAVYSAAGREEGINVAAAYVHDLKTGRRASVPTGADDIKRAKDRARGLVEGIAERKFSAMPERRKCSACDVRFVCQHGPEA